MPASVVATAMCVEEHDSRWQFVVIGYDICEISHRFVPFIDWGLK